MPAFGKLRRTIAIGELLGVAVILGSTLVLVKLVLNDLGPLTVTAFRYTLASMLLLPFLLVRGGFAHYPRALWWRFILLGVSFYVIGNGALYLGLKFVGATTAALLLSFVPLLVMVAGLVALREIPTQWQVAGLAAVLAGGALFFSPGLRPGEPLGIAIVAVGLAGNAAFELVGREAQLRRLTDTLTLTAIPLIVGSAVILPLALLVEGWPEARPSTWALIVLLAGLNTAVVYAVMNHALTVLAAFEVAVIVNLTPLLTAVWSWMLLAEQLQPVQLVGMVTVLLGVILVERHPPDRKLS